MKAKRSEGARAPRVSPAAGQPVPFSRPVAVDRVAEGGMQVAIEARPEECVALAALFGVPAVLSVSADVAVEPNRHRSFRVSGTVRGRVTQTCVVSLEPFDIEVSESIDAEFAEMRADGSAPAAPMSGAEPPDPIVDGVIDLGALATEFLALGLDPYPKKPGITFTEATEAGTPDASPFDALRHLTLKS